MDANNLAEFLQSAAAVAVVARLAGLKLATCFPALIAWLIVVGGMELLLSLFSQSSHRYFWLYMSLVPVACAFGIAAVRELLSLVFRDYPGIRSAGRLAAFIGVAAAAGISLGAASLLQRHGSSGSQHLFYLEVLQRSVVFSLAVVILTVLYFLSRYPLHLTRNTIVSASIFSSLFLSDAVRLLIDSLQETLNSRLIDWTESAFMIACMATWTMLLRPESNTQPARVSFPSPDEQHLLRQLDSLNQLLTRVARN
jgi:hypothetical protein